MLYVFIEKNKIQYNMEFMKVRKQWKLYSDHKKNKNCNRNIHWQQQKTQFSKTSAALQFGTSFMNCT